MNTINRFFHSYAIPLRDNIVIVDNTDDFKIDNIDAGVVSVVSIWSGYSVANIKNAIQKLYEINYPGKIYVIDNDSIDSNRQKEVFSTVCQGYGEIFIVKNGAITASITDKNSFSVLKNNLGQLS